MSIRANIGHSPLQHDLSAWRHDDALMGGTALKDNRGRIKTWACLFVFCVLCLYLSAAVADMPQPNDVTQEAMQRLFATASAPSPAWTGPSTGPAGVTKKIVALIAEDLRNGGILGVAQGVSEAARELRWQIKIFDARGTPEGRKEAAADALAAHPDGVVLIGADVQGNGRSSQALHPAQNSYYRMACGAGGGTDVGYPGCRQRIDRPLGGRSHHLHGGCCRP